MTQATPDGGDLARLEEEISELQADVDSARTQLGAAGEDPEDVASSLTDIEQNEAILATLRERRDRLRAEST